MIFLFVLSGFLIGYAFTKRVPVKENYKGTVIIFKGKINIGNYASALDELMAEEAVDELMKELNINIKNGNKNIPPPDR